MNAEACLGARVDFGDPCGTGPGQAKAGNRPQGQPLRLDVSERADGVIE